MPLFQLRVIRAFRSTLEDMEEKRSVHSLRSTRSYLSRPMSDISYIDEENLSPTAAHYRRQQQHHHHHHHQQQQQQQDQYGRVNGSGSGYSRGAGLRQDSTNSNTPSIATNTVGGGGQQPGQYLKVEGSAYRVHRSNASTSTGTNPAAGLTASGSRSGAAASSRPRASSDAQTQSAESSFACEDLVEQELVAAPQPSVVGYAPATQMVGPCVQVVSTSPQPPQPRGASPILLAPASATSAASAAAAGTAVTVQHAGGALQTHLLPSPIYNFGYDPSYCQPIGQAADGYQYELVRRPSFGPAMPTAADLLTPSNMQMRRPSGGVSPLPFAAAGMGGGGPNPTLAQTHFLNPNSLQGSFDSALGPPPTTPIFIQQQQPPVSPRHLQQQQQQPTMAMASAQAIYFSSGGTASSTPQRQPPPGSGAAPIPPPDWGNPGATTNSAAAAGNTTNNSSDIPKLIHETSI